MTRVYFVRHAEPIHGWEDNRTRPLTEEGQKDTNVVLEFLKERKIDVFYCSPFKRSMDTIRSSAAFYGMEVHTDERLRERQNGVSGNVNGMFQKRWSDFTYHEENGESIGMVQKRNVEALKEILQKEEGKNIVIGTHGTALSTIMNYYDRSYDVNSFLRIIDWMPFVVEMDFEGTELVGKIEHLYINKKQKYRRLHNETTEHNKSKLE